MATSRRLISYHFDCPVIHMNIAPLREDEKERKRVYVCICVRKRLNKCIELSVRDGFRCRMKRERKRERERSYFSPMFRARVQRKLCLGLYRWSDFYRTVLCTVRVNDPVLRVARGAQNWPISHCHAAGWLATSTLPLPRLGQNRWRALYVLEETRVLLERKEIERNITRTCEFRFGSRSLFYRECLVPRFSCLVNMRWYIRQNDRAESTAQTWRNSSLRVILRWQTVVWAILLTLMRVGKPRLFNQGPIFLHATLTWIPYYQHNDTQR